MYLIVRSCVSKDIRTRGIHEVPRVAEGEYLKMLYSLREVQGAGLELEHLAICQSGGAKYRDTNRFIDFLRE